ncbi:MAG TPA: hypothetical protein VGW96_01705 [Candidatus Eremiobacteraceae bacterium]|jgi:hypothetical protein|nr:hypothetical protein [Candidatus Eremiobacteraceae bacterium]
MRVITTICIAMLILITAACSGHKQTIVTKEGTATIETNQHNDTTTVTSKEGTATFGKNAVDLSKLGLPVYPGASVDTGGMNVQSNQGSEQIEMLTTADSFDKVYGWYKSHMPADSEKMHMSSGGQSLAQFAIGKEGEKNIKSVMIAESNGKTTIQLVVGSKT